MDKQVWVSETQREEAKRQIALVSLSLVTDMDIAMVQLDLAIAYLGMFKKEYEDKFLEEINKD